LVNQQTIKAIAVQHGRFLSTAPKEEKKEQPPPPQYGTFRTPAASLGVLDPPVVDHNNWIKRKQQKLRDFVDYEKAFAAHAAERRHL
jgi:ATPase complex subunit ATP10